MNLFNKNSEKISSLTSKVATLEEANQKLTVELKDVRNDLKNVKIQYTRLENQINETIRNTVGETPVAVVDDKLFGESILSYHLRTSPQTQSKNYRYFYKSNYLFTAPLNLKNILTIEFNRLMNSNLSFENVIEELKVYKTSLQHELESNGIQTELNGVFLNE